MPGEARRDRREIGRVCPSPATGCNAGCRRRDGRRRRPDAGRCGPYGPSVDATKSAMAETGIETSCLAAFPSRTSASDTLRGCARRLWPGSTSCATAASRAEAGFDAIDERIFEPGVQGCSSSCVRQLHQHQGRRTTPKRMRASAIGEARASMHAPVMNSKAVRRSPHLPRTAPAKRARPPHPERRRKRSPGIGCRGTASAPRR